MSFFFNIQVFKDSQPNIRCICKSVRLCKQTRFAMVGWTLQHSWIELWRVWWQSVAIVSSPSLILSPSYAASMPYQAPPRISALLCKLLAWSTVQPKFLSNREECQTVWCKAIASIGLSHTGHIGGIVLHPKPTFDCGDFFGMLMMEFTNLIANLAFVVFIYRVTINFH